MHAVTVLRSFFAATTATGRHLHNEACQGTDHGQMCCKLRVCTTVKPYHACFTCLPHWCNNVTTSTIPRITSWCLMCARVLCIQTSPKTHFSDGKQCNHDVRIAIPSSHSPNPARAPRSPFEKQWRRLLCILDPNRILWISYSILVATEPKFGTHFGLVIVGRALVPAVQTGKD